MYRRTWPTLGITLLAVGLFFLGIGVLLMYYIAIWPSLILVLIGLALAVGGICILRWYLKNKK